MLSPHLGLQQFSRAGLAQMTNQGMEDVRHTKGFVRLSHDARVKRSWLHLSSQP